jgi:hypothetical protein
VLIGGGFGLGVAARFAVEGLLVGEVFAVAERFGVFGVAEVLGRGVLVVGSEGVLDEAEAVSGGVVDVE